MVELGGAMRLNGGNVSSLRGSNLSLANQLPVALADSQGSLLQYSYMLNVSGKTLALLGAAVTLLDVQVCSFSLWLLVAYRSLADTFFTRNIL
jgi:hypothetical protein